MYNQLFCFSGAGGTGKSTVLNAVVEKLNREERPHSVLPSVVRGYYAAQGVVDQAAYMALPAPRRRAFQLGLLDHYFETLTTHLADNPGLVLCDRSPFDHLAYALDSVDVTLAELRTLQARVKAFADAHIGGIAFFPYPAAFSQDVDPDSFRVAHPSQNMKIHSLMFTALAEAYANDLDLIVFLGADSGVEERANDVIDLIDDYDIGAPACPAT